MKNMKVFGESTGMGQLNGQEEGKFLRIIAQATAYCYRGIVIEKSDGDHEVLWTDWREAYEMKKQLNLKEGDMIRIFDDKIKWYVEKINFI